MLVSDILRVKGGAVKTVRSADSALFLAVKLRDERIGAMVVSDNGGLDGIVSERDLACGLAEHGSALHQILVADLMTRNVFTCSPGEPINQVMQAMTQRRVRHVPVVDRGKLVGVVSIGDILKHRLDEMKLEASVLRDYAIARG